jgi:dipeptidyl aminopeptidase/acylaminoacyl peptidase
LSGAAALRSFAALAVAVVCSGFAPAPRLVGLDDLDGVKTGQVAMLSTLDLSADGRMLAIERGGELSVVDVPSRRILTRLGEGLMPRWSPNGKQLAFYSRRSGALQLWLWHDGQLRQLTRLPNGIDPDIETRIMGYIGDAFRYSWSPQSDRIVFASRVAFRDLDAKAPDAPLVLTTTTLPAMTLQGVFAHPGGGTGGVIQSSNGRDLSFRAARPGEVLFNQLFVADIRTRDLVQLTQERATSFDPAWSPDGGTIAFARVDADRDNPDGDIIAARRGKIVLLDLSTRHARMVDAGGGIKFQPLWSPDGRRLAYLTATSFESDASIRVARRADGRKLETIGLHAPVVQYAWDRGAHGDGFIVSDAQAASGQKGVAQVRDVAELGRALSQSVGPWSQDSQGAIAWVEDEAGPDVWLSTTAAPRKLLSLSSPDELKLAKSEDVTWHNRRNEALQGRLLYPAAYVKGRRYPLIVDVYPFPGSGGWMNPMSGNQAWASAGYMVFKPQPRAPHSAPNCSGSPAFCAAGQGPAGLDVMVDDVMSGIAALDRRGLIDRNRMCLYGHSNGGGVADYLITRTYAFKCAVVVAPVLPNWLGTSFLWYDGLGLMSRLAGAKPWENPDAYVKLSAVLHVDKEKTPMLLADGDEDGAFLLGSIELYTALRAANADVTFVRYPNQGHVLTGTALHDFWRREMTFFAKFLNPRR